MKLDIKKWNEARKELEAAIKDSKDRQRETMQPRWRHGPDDYKKSNMKRDATELYALRAALRGEQHCESWPIEEALELLPEYSLPVEEKQMDAVAL